MFEFSPNVAIQVKDYDKALNFYENVIGFKVARRYDGSEDICGGVRQTEYKFGPMTFWIEDNPNMESGGGTFFEFAVEDVEDAVDRLLQNGCELTQKFSDTSFIFKDPFGMKFHVFRKGQGGEFFRN